MGIHRFAAALCLAPAGLASFSAAALENGEPLSKPVPFKQDPADANFTGPLIATSPASLGQGHIDAEAYLIWSDTRGTFDQHHRRHSLKRDTRSWSSSMLVYVGLLSNLDAQVIFNGSHTTTPQGSTDGFRMGDTKVRLLYQFNHPDPHSRVPTFGLVVGKSIPSGKYQRLGDNPLNGVGTGSRAWTFTLASQMLFWMPNGHILRARANLGWITDSQRIGLHGTSSYDTPHDFYGWARQGRQGWFDVSMEYCLTSHWVLAMDVMYTRFAANRVYQYAQSKGSHLYRDDGGGESLQWAPAVEYNWDSHIGLIAGVQMTSWGRNTNRTVSPQMALNIYY